MASQKKQSHTSLYSIMLLMLVSIVLLSVGVFWQLKVAGVDFKRAPVALPLSIESDSPITPLLAAVEATAEMATTSRKESETAGLQRYIIVTDSCNEYFVGECLKVRSGPSTEAPTVMQLRNGMVLKISESVQAEERLWYKITFDEWLRYPERVVGEWYVAAEYVTLIHDDGELLLAQSDSEIKKKIVVDRSEQSLVAYDDNQIFMEARISTGLELTPTPRGVFSIYKKMPSRYMQGPLPYLENSKYYDLPGVPWNLYFTDGGAVIHGAYWHNNFGTAYSHGCVNLKPEEARTLYVWADVGTTVVVQD